MASLLTQASSRPPIKGERGTFTASDDNAMMKQIIATHAPDGRDVDVKPILRIVEEIFDFSAPPTRATLEAKTKDVDAPSIFEAHLDAPSSLEALAYIINRLSCELSYKCVGGIDGHSTAVSLFNMLSSYSWEAKLVLNLAAFALNYGEFCLLAQIYSTNMLAKKMAILKQLPEMLEHTEQLKPRFEALQNLIKSILELTKNIVALTELPPKYISSDNSAFSTAVTYIPTAVYWIFRSVICCANFITYLSGTGIEFTTSATEIWELASLAHKIMNLNEHLKKQLSICNQHIGEKKQLEDYDALLHTFQAVHIDNMKTLKSLIYPKDDLSPLIDGNSKRRVNLDVLRRKTVLLLISGLDISQDELSILEQIYSESRMHGARLDSLYELIWIPVVDHSAPWTEATQRQFENLQMSMPWYTVYNPSLISQAATRFIKENWHFRNKPILVVLDPQGKVVNPNALHMMWIWGSNAFPFTSNREEALWREETWRLELLVDGIDPMMLNWITEGKHIIFYGGDDLEWIRKFTTVARSVAQTARIPLEIVYVGKSSNREQQLRRIITTIQKEKLSYVWLDIAMIWFFWTRLESMFFSKIQLGRIDESDPLLQNIKKLLSYDKSGVWAIYSRGSNVVINGFGTTVLAALERFDAWKNNVEETGFDNAFKNVYEGLGSTDRPCLRFEWSTDSGRTPENMKCPECNRFMEKYVTFTCCHDTPK